MDSNQRPVFTGCYGVRPPFQCLFSDLKTDSIPVAPLLTIGLFGFAWTSLGPPHVHWIAPMIFSCLIAIANVSGMSLTTRQLLTLHCSSRSIWRQSTI